MLYSSNCLLIQFYPIGSFYFIAYSVGSDFSVTCEQLGDNSTVTQWFLDGDLLSQGFPATLDFSSFSDTLHSKSYTCRDQFGDGIDVTYLTIVIGNELLLECTCNRCY